MSDTGGLIEWISPSAVARIQSCGLAESRRRSPSMGTRPSSPISRLGDAAHRVLEWVADTSPDLAGNSEAESRIAERWSYEVAVEARSACSNPVETPHGPVERWPSYGRIAASLRVDGAVLASDLAELPSEQRLAEHELASSDGLLRGTADLIVIDGDGNALVVDHKMGAVGEEDVEQGGRYEQQVLLYVAMARDSGINASSAEIRPLGQAAVPVPLSDDRLAAVVVEARNQMNRYNSAVAAGRELELASPSESSCGWCPYILDCPAIWGSESPDLGDIRVVEGDLGTVQRLPTSAAVSIRTEDGDVVAVGVPQRDVHGRLPEPGDRVRITGLSEASTGRLRGGYRTLLRVLDR